MTGVDYEFRAKMINDLPNPKHPVAQRRVEQIKVQAGRLEPIQLKLPHLGGLIGRHRHQVEPGRISDEAGPILDALKIDPKHWDEPVHGYGEPRVTALHALDRLIQFAAEINRRWLIGQ